MWIVNIIYPQKPEDGAFSIARRPNLGPPQAEGGADELDTRVFEDGHVAFHEVGRVPAESPGVDLEAREFADLGAGTPRSKIRVVPARGMGLHRPMRAKPVNIGVYVNDPKANILQHVRCLRNWGMRFRSVWREDLAALKPGDCDVLLLHGGWYGIDRVPGQEQYAFRATPENRRMAEAIRRFTRAGGGVVGVCCGAFNIVWLGLIEADISRTQGTGEHTLEVVDERHPIVKPVLRRAKGRKDRRWLPIPCMRFNGPIFFPKKAEQMVLSYDWEHRLGAVLAGSYGRGRAVAISPHPEATENERDQNLLNEPLMPVSEMYRAALLWAAGRKV